MVFKTIACSMMGVGSAIAFTLATVQSAIALPGFTGDFDVSNFTFTASPSGAGNSTNNLDTTNAGTGEVILYGADTNSSTDYIGNGLGDLTANGGASVDWTINITSARAGNISFEWLYNSLDSGVDDTAGYLLNGNYTVLGATNGQSSASPVSILVSNGDVFGFRVFTASNTGGEGYLTISNFQATPVPFEFSSTTGILVFLGGFWGVRQSRKFFSVK